MKMLDRPCGTCGWKYAGFHICVDHTKSTPLPTRQQIAAGGGWRGNQNSLDSIGAHGNKLRWEMERERNRERDAKFIELYQTDEYSIRAAGRQFGIDYRQGRGILERAGVPVRGRGQQPGRGFGNQL